MLRLRLKFRVTSLTINSHWRREREIIFVPNSLNTEQSRLELLILIDEAVKIHVKLDLFSSHFLVVFRHGFSSNLRLHLTGPEDFFNKKNVSSLNR